jgi:hypothetical protein
MMLVLVNRAFEFHFSSGLGFLVTPLGKVEGKLNTFILFREKILRVRKA